MTSYPSGVYAPRTKQNKAGVTYDPDLPTNLFAEDITKLDDEVVAIESELGANPKGASDDVASRLTTIEESIPTNIPTEFTDLLDVPTNYIDDGGKILAVKTDESGLEFITAPTGGTSKSLLSLNDMSIEIDPSGILYYTLTSINYSTTQGDYQKFMPALKIKYIKLFFQYVSKPGGNINITILKNGVSTGLTSTITTEGQQLKTITGDITVTETDYIEIKFENTDSVNSMDSAFDIYTQIEL